MSLLLPSAVFLIVGCQGAESKSAPGDAPSRGGAGSSAATVEAERRVVLFVGTSLTAAHGLEVEQGFPAAVQEKIDSAGLPFEVVNAGLSGETSAGAVTRVEKWLIRQPFDVLVLETGANDMLRGSPVPAIRRNIQEIIDTVRAARPDARIVLAGMLAAPNLGERYVREFGEMYRELARENDLVLIPFLLDGVAGRQELNLGDGIHPNPRGQRIIAGTVWKTLEPVLREEAGEGGG